MCLSSSLCRELQDGHTASVEPRCCRSRDSDVDPDCSCEVGHEWKTDTLPAVGNSCQPCRHGHIRRVHSVAVSCCAEEEPTASRLAQANLLALLYSGGPPTARHPLVAELPPSTLPGQPTAIGSVERAIVQILKDTVFDGVSPITRLVNWGQNIWIVVPAPGNEKLDQCRIPMQNGSVVKRIIGWRRYGPLSFEYSVV